VWTLYRFIASPDKKVNVNYLGPASVEEIARYLSDIHSTTIYWSQFVA